MDKLKQTLQNQTPEERKERDKKLLLPNAIELALCIAMVVIGAQYSDPSDCRTGNVSLFLRLGGGIVLMTTALKILAVLTPCTMDDKIVQILSPVLEFVHLCVVIWGSISVFGKDTYFKQIGQEPACKSDLNKVSN